MGIKEQSLSSLQQLREHHQSLEVNPGLRELFHGSLELGSCSTQLGSGLLDFGYLELVPCFPVVAYLVSWSCLLVTCYLVVVPWTWFHGCLIQFAWIHFLIP